MSKELGTKVEQRSISRRLLIGGGLAVAAGFLLACEAAGLERLNQLTGELKDTRHPFLIKIAVDIDTLARSTSLPAELRDYLFEGNMPYKVLFNNDPRIGSVILPYSEEQPSFKYSAQGDPTKILGKTKLGIGVELGSVEDSFKPDSRLPTALILAISHIRNMMVLKLGRYAYDMALESGLVSITDLNDQRIASEKDKIGIGTTIMLGKMKSPQNDELKDLFLATRDFAPYLFLAQSLGILEDPNALSTRTIYMKNLYTAKDVVKSDHHINTILDNMGQIWTRDKTFLPSTTIMQFSTILPISEASKDLGQKVKGVINLQPDGRA